MTLYANRLDLFSKPVLLATLSEAVVTGLFLVDSGGGLSKIVGIASGFSLFLLLIPKLAPMAESLS